MDALKIKRTQCRRLFTKSLNEYENVETTLSETENFSKLKLLEEKAKKMIESEELVREELLISGESEDVINREFDESEAYIDKWRILERKLSALLDNNDCNSVVSVNTASKNTMILYPKLKLPLFDGNIKNWLGFWGQFKKINSDSSLDDHDKFAYLQQSMEKGSPAEELIKSFPPGGESYHKALEQLKARYGKEDLLIEVYVRDLLSLVLEKNSNKKFSLRKLHDSLESKLRALEILGVARNKYAAMLYPLVESSLPNETLRAWQRFRVLNRKRRELGSDEENNSQNDQDSSYRMDLDGLLLFLLDEIEGEERVSLANKSFGANQSVKSYSSKDYLFKSHGKSPSIPSASSLISTIKENQSCIFCSGSHKSCDCYKARKMSVEERNMIVQTSQCCFLCLDKSHKIAKCRKKSSCIVCGKRHHELLCRNIQSESKGQSIPTIEKEDNCQISHRDETLANLSKSPNVILQTLMVTLRGKGFQRQVRAIIDSASQRSYILNSTASDMNFEKSNKEKLCHSLFGGTSTAIIEHDIFTIYMSKPDGSYRCNFKALGQDVICASMPPIVSGDCIVELNKIGICINDQSFCPIEILIGADIAGKLMTGGFRLLNSGLAAIETKLGWTVMGKTTVSDISKNSTLLVTSMLNKEVLISDLWSLDSLGILEPSEKKNQIELHEAARDHFLNTVCVNDEGRFQVNLPWLENHVPLQDNFDLATKRLNNIVKRLKAENLYEAYGEVFKEWEEEGIIEEIPDKEIDLPCYYLPHRHVVKENSTTKIRPVFDASARKKGAPSLNDCVEKGMNLIELIPSVLNRFRFKQIGVTSNIRKAFLQISINPKDRNYLRFLWHKLDGSLKYFRHCRVVFGVSCSPFLLGSVIHYHLESILRRENEENHKYPLKIIDHLKKSFYVDNCLTSVDNEEELRQFIQLSRDALAERKFDLRGWEYTDALDSSLNPTNVLGMSWERSSDTLSLNIISILNDFPENITKRTILATTHKVYDPLGISSPVTLLPKLLLQRLWKEKISWDKEVDIETKSEFRKWLNNLNLLRKLRIPRWINIDNQSEHISLHFFCDASKVAYSAVAFVRVERKNLVHVHLLQAKARIAPCGKRETTITRLELLGATISARLASNILKEVSHHEAYFWTDSSTVLAWIQRNEIWDVFVHNRVQEIRQLTNEESWRHVPGTINPADLSSRGCGARYLVESKWWEGPNWLYLPPEEWPKNDFISNEDEIAREKKKKVISSMVNIDSCDFINNRFSSYRKLVRMMAWICRFVNDCRNKKREKNELNVNELNEAEKVIIRLIQSSAFSGVKDKRLESLSPFLEDGIVRSKTAIFQRDDTSDFRTPVILPNNHPIVRIMIMEEHKKKGHVGVSHVLNSLREKFWILAGRRTVSSVLRTCTVCKRYSSKNVNPPAPPLPADRVRDAATFQITGIDFTGPLILRDKSKAWICLFTSAVYRCVHLELVTSLSTEAFLQAFHRFVSRRGRPSVVYTDNGKNFVGTSNAFALIDFKYVSKKMSDDRIIWKFIPPGAPWWGGWWERLIGIMKRVLRKILGRASLNYEEMYTVICNSEAILNDRPLTVVAADSDLTAITPSNFLKEIQNDQIPNFRRDIDAKFLKNRLRHIQNLREDFKKRFRLEYLGALKITKKKSSKVFELKAGDIVLIGSDDKRRLFWPLARILELYPGSDGISRRARVKTQNGELFRAVQNLIPLEVSSAEEISPIIKMSTNLNKFSKMSKKPEKVFAHPVTKEFPEIRRTGRTVRIPDRLDL